MSKELTELVKIQFRSFFREPGIIFWALVFPILISWVLGIAFNTKTSDAFNVMVVNNAQSSASSVFNAAYFKSNKTIGSEIKATSTVHFLQGTREQALKAIRKGEIAMYVTQENDSLKFHYDPKNQQSRSYHLLLERDLALTNKNFIKSAIVPLSSIGNRYIDFLIPGLIAFGIMNTCLWGISYNLIEYRMKKLLRRMVATPMHKSNFLLSVIIARISLSFIETFLLIAFAYFVFGTFITGSIIAFLLVFVSGIIVFSGLAIIISSRTSNSQVGNGIINAVILPCTILSGVFFNYHNFPEWAIKIIKILPLTMLVDSLRGLYIEYYTLQNVLLPCTIMVSIGSILFIIGIKIYKWY